MRLESGKRGSQRYEGKRYDGFGHAKDPGQFRCVLHEETCTYVNNARFENETNDVADTELLLFCQGFQSVCCALCRYNGTGTFPSTDVPVCVMSIPHRPSYGIQEKRYTKTQ